MNSKIAIETLEALRNGEHYAFETIFIAYYNKIQSFIDRYIKSDADAEDLTENLFVNLWT
ncbi:MAG: RNA polymerase sigma-70 factor, partial [Candidatus Symbiothrix sp.]|nr:RNA polymerase sigma-70 factor [Candidatus Symbiothrix sp.]